MTPKQLLKKVFPPMLATLAESPPHDDANWTYELKYDGFRAIIAITADGIAMLSRNELDLAPRFPRTYEALKKVKAKELVVDGEVVVLDQQGAPRFQLLQQGGDERLILFDILWLDGKDLRRLPYLDRRKLLEKTFKKPPAGITVAQILSMTGGEALDLAAKGGWEGVIAKRKTSVYEPRRSKEWLKIKTVNEQEFVIVGWQPSSATDRDIGSLHLAVNENGELRYAGKVGTGFSVKLRTTLHDELAKDVVAKSPVKDAPRDKHAIWTKPRLVAQVAFGEWTSDHRLRHPSFLGLRDDKRVEEVVREKASPSSSRGQRSGQTPREGTGDPASTRGINSEKSSKVTFTNPDRLLYPKDGITKKDVAAYFEAMAEPMLRALKDRPLALEHWNQGITKPAWFHQSIGKEGPSWLKVVETPTRTTKSGVAKHLVVDSVDALRWLAQMSALTIHMWSSRAESLEEPDWILFDLDPAKGKGIEQAVEAAIVMRKLLENLELPGVPKTSGKRGIHVFVPLVSGSTHEQVAEFACSIAAAVAAKVPGITVERALANRRGRLYLDCMQNGYGKTVVAPYSLRAIDGAPVSAPLQWSEITKKLDPLKFNLRTMPNRLAKVGDLFADVFKNRVKLPKLK
ncbi:MAG TPA: DNA ligase D [Thermoanaerobaculia bacterium]|jgi:bifunctional non-homologous end joining protein LigD|nr:DNA ligase D [Thermoanaerobaculia bacterium]